MMHWLDTACPSVATLKPEDRRARHYLLSDATELRKFWNGGDSETSNQLQSSRSWGDSSLQSKRRAFAELVLAGLSTKLFVERSRSDFFVPIVLRSLCLKSGHVLSFVIVARSHLTMPVCIRGRVCARVLRGDAPRRIFESVQSDEITPGKPMQASDECVGLRGQVRGSTHAAPPREDVMLPLKWLGGQHRKLLLQKGLVQWNNKEDAAIQRSMEDATMKWKKSKKNKKARTETRERGGAQSNET